MMWPHRWFCAWGATAIAAIALPGLSVAARPISLAEMQQAQPDGVQTAIFYPDGQHLLVALRSGPRQELLRVAFQGGSAEPLAPNHGFLFDPALAPDGQSVVFSSKKEEAANLFLLRTGTSEVIPLTHGEGWNYNASFSPDGNMIVFAFAAAGRMANIAVLSLKDRAVRFLTQANEPGYGPHNTLPIFSRDGAAVLFWESEFPQGKGWSMWKLQIASIDGSLFTPLSDDRFDNAANWVAVAPGGSVAFGIPSEDYDTAWIFSFEHPASILPLRPQGSGYVQLDDYERNLKRLAFPAFSPNGEILLFTKQEEGGIQELHILNVASGDGRQLTFLNLNITQPLFSPDGEWIAFIAAAPDQKDARQELWRMKADGAEPHPLPLSLPSAPHPGLRE